MNQQFPLDSMFIFSIASDIASGLNYIHKSYFQAHGSLKPSNCVIDSRWTCRVTGFGTDLLKQRSFRTSEVRSELPRDILSELDSASASEYSGELVWVACTKMTIEKGTIKHYFLMSYCHVKGKVVLAHWVTCLRTRGKRFQVLPI